MSNLTPQDEADLARIEAALAKLAEQAKPLKAEKRAILNRNRVRAHYQRQKAPTQS